MPYSPDTLVDGDYSRATPVGAPRYSYPFLGNKDIVSATFEQDFWQTVETYTPPDLSTPYSQALPDFRLVAESNPVRFMANLIAFTRTYARVPVPQITYSTIALNKPSPATLGVDRGTITDFTGSETGTTIGTGYSYGGRLFGNNTVYARNTATSSLTLPSGGTFTVTFGANTTAALAYNETNVNIAAAINALASVVSAGITVTVSNALNSTGVLQIDLTVGTTATRFTCDGSSLTPAASATMFTTINSAIQQNARTAYRSTVTNHGFSSILPLMVARAADNAQALIPQTTHWVSVDANTIATDVGLVSTAPSYVGQYVRAYTPGVDRIRTRLTDTFYLPGVSTGITSATDIPVPDIAANDALLLALLAGSATGYQNYDAQPLSLWMGQIYHQTVIAVDIDNF